MSANPHLSLVSVDNCLDKVLDALNGGTIKIYDSTGTGQPANPDVAVTTQVLIATLTLGSPAFGAAAAGSKTANVITSATAVATKTATWFRALTSGGVAVIDGNVGTTASFDLTISSTSVTTGDTVSCSSWVASMAQ